MFDHLSAKICGQHFKIYQAKSYKEKLNGLLVHPPLKPNESMLFKTTLIHTFFMKYPLDIVFLNHRYKILHIQKTLKPFRFSKFVWGTKYILEFHHKNHIINFFNTGDFVEIQA